MLRLLYATRKVTEKWSAVKDSLGRRVPFWAVRLRAGDPARASFMTSVEAVCPTWAALAQETRRACRPSEIGHAYLSLTQPRRRRGQHALASGSSRKSQPAWPVRMVRILGAHAAPARTAARPRARPRSGLAS